MRSPTRRARLALGLLLGSVVLSGCDADVYSLPLPGGTDVGEDPIEVTVQFADVLDLVPKSTVKVNDVSVGEVEAIELDGYTAEVTLRLREDVELPDNAVAQIRQTSLLGEKFVSLEPPASGASQTMLGDGDVIPLERSGRNPEVEEVLGALSLVLNGGGVAQLKTIAQEVNKAVTGREDDVRSVLTQIDTFTAELDTNKAQIVTAIEALNRLAKTAHEQEDDIDEALDELPSALTSIDGQRQDLVRMLTALDELSDVGVRVIGATKDATIHSLEQLQPVLGQLAASGDDLVNAVNVFYSYPFVDEVVGRDPQVARNLHMGDYTNLSITLDLDLSKLALPTTLPLDLPAAVVDEVTECLDHAIGGGALTDPVCSDLVGTQVLQDYCADHPAQDICTIIALIPGLPELPLGDVLGGHNGGGNGGGTGTPGPLPTPSVPLPSAPLGDTLGGVVGGLLGGLGRSATGPAYDAGGAGDTERGQGLTMGQLQSVYDPALVSLLVPGLVAPPAEGGAQR